MGSRRRRWQGMDIGAGPGEFKRMLAQFGRSRKHAHGA